MVHQCPTQLIYKIKQGQANCVEEREQSTTAGAFAGSPRWLPVGLAAKLAGIWKESRNVGAAEFCDSLSD